MIYFVSLTPSVCAFPARYLRLVVPVINSKIDLISEHDQFMHILTSKWQLIQFKYTYTHRVCRPSYEQ